MLPEDQTSLLALSLPARANSFGDNLTSVSLPSILPRFPYTFLTKYFSKFFVSDRRTILASVSTKKNTSMTKEAAKMVLLVSNLSRTSRERVLNLSRTRHEPVSNLSKPVRIHWKNFERAGKRWAALQNLLRNTVTVQSTSSSGY